MIKERIPISGDLKSGYFHCGAVLRRTWCSNDENHPEVLPQVFWSVLSVVFGTEKDELGCGF